MTVFMDTWDAAHQRVKSYLDSYSGSIVTTEWVLLEFADAFSLYVDWFYRQCDGVLAPGRRRSPDRSTRRTSEKTRSNQ